MSTDDISGEDATAAYDEIVEEARAAVNAFETGDPVEPIAEPKAGDARASKAHNEALAAASAVLGADTDRSSGKFATAYHAAHAAIVKRDGA